MHYYSKMYSTLFIFTLFLSIFVAKSRDICDECVCRYNTKSDQDIHGESVDCSYNPSILTSNYSVPRTVHSMDLSTNNLSRIVSSSLLRSRTMVELYLNNNHIIQIDANALDLPELKRLDLSDNRLEVVYEDTFKNIKKLEYLNLANNKFTTFSKLTFHHLSNLEEIILDNNNIGPTLRKIDIFDRSGYGLTYKIKSISISTINLNTVPDNFFAYAYDIKKLIISNNNLSNIFEVPFTLQYLDLSDNPIKEISMEDFIDLPALKVLKLNNLQIKEVPDYMFSPLRALESLELERNKNLTQFSTLAFGQEVLDDPDDFLLQELSLRNSRLKTLDQQLSLPFGQLIKLDLQGNPWICDCKLLWLKTLQIQPKDYDHVRCSTPKPLYNSRVFELDAKYLTCPEHRHLVGLTIAAVSLCLMFAVVAVWLFLGLPRYQARCRFLQNMGAPSTAYTVLPVSTGNTPF